MVDASKMQIMTHKNLLAITPAPKVILFNPLGGSCAKKGK